MGRHINTAEAADDYVSEHGTTKHPPRQFGPVGRREAMDDAAALAGRERRMARIAADIAPALAQIERIFGRKPA